MPTKQLPPDPSLVQLKHQAKELVRALPRANAALLQRIREFHPRYHRSSDEEIIAARFSLSDAQLVLAREYGFASWPKLKAFLDGGERPKLDLPLLDRIDDQAFRRAVELLDEGDVKELQDHLAQHPGVLQRRVELEGANYFRNPTLLNFVANNPVRSERMPPNIVEIAKTLLDSGTTADHDSVNETLGLVSSGRVVREHKVQVPLIELLCDYGADPNSALLPALAHGEFEAANALVRNGAKAGLALAAATGNTEQVARQLRDANRDERHQALALAAQFGHAPALRVLLKAGEDPNRYNPLGLHSHSTPLHQAVWSGDLQTVRALVEAGAKLDMRDTNFDGTPLDWAKYGKHNLIAEYLEEAAAGRDHPPSV